MSKNTITCPECEGTGRRELRTPYPETLALFARHAKHTAADVAERLSIDKTAAMMRVWRLTEWGLLEYQEQGGKSGRLYSLTPRKTRKAK